MILNTGVTLYQQNCNRLIKQLVCAGTYFLCAHNHPACRI